MLVTPDLLRTFSLFETLGAEDLNYLAQRAQIERFARRAVILNAGSQEGRVCFLFEGRLQGVDFTIDGREVGLYFVDPGDYCGELSVFDSGAQPEYVIALNSAVVVFVPVEALREVADESVADAFEIEAQEDARDGSVERVALETAGASGKAQEAAHAKLRVES